MCGLLACKCNSKSFCLSKAVSMSSLLLGFSKQHLSFLCPVRPLWSDDSVVVVDPSRPLNLWIVIGVGRLMAWSSDNTSMAIHYLDLPLRLCM